MSLKKRNPSHEETREESWAREAAWNLVKTFISSKNKDKTIFYSPVEAKVPVFISTSQEVRMFVIDSGASMHMLSKRELSSAEMDTLRRSRIPRHGGDSKWGSPNNRGGISIRT